MFLYSLLTTIKTYFLVDFFEHFDFEVFGKRNLFKKAGMKYEYNLKKK